MTERSRSGTDVIRAAMRQRAAHGDLARMARDLNLSLTQLDSFTYHGGQLAPEALQLLATDLFAGHATFDPATNLLGATNKTPAIPGGIRPPQFDPKSRPPVDRTIRGPSPPVKGATLQPARPHRPGWAE